MSDFRVAVGRPKDYAEGVEGTNEMRGRPQVLGLLAFAVAFWFASPVAAPPAAAEFRFQIPGLFEKKKPVKRRRDVRPTLPSRNPTRVTAGLSAKAVAPPQAKDSEAMTAAGATSSATVTLALLAAAEEPARTAQAPQDEATQNESLGAAETDDASDETVETVAEAETEVEPEPALGPDSAAGDIDMAAQPDPDGQDIDPATADAPTPEAAQPDALALDAPAAAPETTETAAAEEGDDAKAQVAAGLVAAAAEIEEIAAAAEREASEETPKPGEETAASPQDGQETTAVVDDEALAPQETAAGAPAKDEADEPASEPAEQTAEATGGDEAAPAEKSGAMAAVPETAEAPTAPSPTPLPAHDAIVVLKVSPPPEDILAVKDEASERGPQEDDAQEIEVAALTPPVAPDPKSADVSSEDVSSANEIATEEDETAAEEKDPAESSEDSTAQAASDGLTEESLAEDSATTEQSAPASDEAPSPNAETAAASDPEDSSDPEAVAEPAPPPAHPVIAEVRKALEDTSRHKTVAASDLAALKAFYDVHEGAPLWVTDGRFKPKARALIAEIRKADDWGLDAGSFELPPVADTSATPEAAAGHELQLSIAALSYARDAQIGRLTPRKVSKLFDQKPSLRDPKSVFKALSDSEDPSAYLLSLHPQQDQFKRLHKALLQARQSAEATGRDPRNDRDVQLITMNMERWRWLPRDIGDYHVWNNVPEFNVRVNKGGRTIYQAKTIVGQLKYATPFFSSEIRNIVFHPNWTVPPTIVREDIAPKLQGRGSGGFFGNSKEATLRRYGLKAHYKGERINADTVDWNNVNVHAYSFVQDPGPANVLGKFKFNFPNKHAIYMHDTVQPELFSVRTRTLSHGCIRVHQPERLVTLLLSEDKGWTAGTVRNLVVRNESKVVALKRRVPVHLTYFTAVVDEHGALNRPGDIYGIDNRMAPRLFSNPASFPAPVASTVADSRPQSRSSQRDRRRGGGLDNFISGLFGN